MEVSRADWHHRRWNDRIDDGETIERGRTDIRLSSRHPDSLEPLVKRLGTRVSAGTPLEAARFGEVVMLAVPLAATPDLARDLAMDLAGKIALDTGNAYERRDGAKAREATAHPRGSASWAADMFPGARWVKAFNSVYFKTLESEAHRSGERMGIRWRATTATLSRSPRGSSATRVLIR